MTSRVLVWSPVLWSVADGARSIIRVYAMRHTTSVEFWIAMVMMLMLLVENSGREVGRRLLLVLLREVKDISGGRYWWYNSGDAPNGRRSTGAGAADGS